MRRVVLVTRPEPGLSETMRAVAELGFEPLAAPLLRIEPLSPAIPKRVQAVLLTSGQAVAPLAALAPWLLQTPVLAVGDATAARARAEGFERVRSAEGDAARLAALATRAVSPDAGPLLLACGRGQGAPLVAVLRQAGFRVLRRCVYRAAPVDHLLPDALDVLNRDAMLAVLFFSAQSARTFRRVLPRRLQSQLHAARALAISAGTAEALSGLGWQDVLVAAKPNAAALLDLLPA